MELATLLDWGALNSKTIECDISRILNDSFMFYSCSLGGKLYIHVTVYVCSMSLSGSIEAAISLSAFCNMLRMCMYLNDCDQLKPSVLPFWRYVAVLTCISVQVDFHLHSLYGIFVLYMYVSLMLSGQVCLADFTWWISNRFMPKQYCLSTHMLSDHIFSLSVFRWRVCPETVF